MNGLDLRHHLHVFLLRAWLPVAIIALWWFTSETNPSLYFPPLSEIVDEIVGQWIFGPRLVEDLLPTLANFVAGLTIALVAGTVFGVILGRSPVLRAFLAPIINFFRSLPSPALIPIVLALFGLGNSMSIALIAIGAVWPTLLNTIDGVRSVDTQVRDMARSYRLTPWQIISQVVLPSAGPQIVAGYRISLQISIILIVVSEMVGATRGLGYFVLESQQLFQVPQTWAGTIMLGLLGYLLTSVFVVIERRVLRWQIRMREATGAA
ncbi:ABC transporter permease [Microbacterium thalassium]|uniref:ABC-type nitrate/sulfonate/bicarbonate transport system permease component n=1 Tax=Microbacterium thalassium TaxID=362649 RepID=A0A7X0KT90_9MICO|nr:ABC transporter permease [Microbacterium thalassium]MBB6389837.1 ABC-type nitrate/sulfonate/bicarbonate transport system permease component [Microbacterium thalassium]GLK24525.1 nitrate ABC transporter permease [Microbacterium thalassium]